MLDVERRKTVRSIMRACLRGAAGRTTAPDEINNCGLRGSVVGAPGCQSHVVFCRVGPALVVVISLRLSPAGKVLCSCRGSTENVSLASSTGHDNTCWHAGAFSERPRELSEDIEAITRATQAHSDEEPYFFLLDLGGSRCAVALDRRT